MNKKLTLILLVLIFSCNSDDSDISPNNNAPVGKLIKTETNFLTLEFSSVITYSYDSLGRILKISIVDSNSNGNSTTSTNYLYNSDGQIWKENISNGTSREYQYTNGLISSSTSSSSNGYFEYVQNNDSQLTTIRYYEEDNLISETDLIYDSENNVINTIIGTTVSAYDYDTMNSWRFLVYENQELNKIFLQGPNNLTSRNGFITYTYTYNSLGYPKTSKEYHNGTLVGETTYTYQE